MKLKHIAAVAGLSLVTSYALAGSVANTTICTPISKQAMQGTNLTLPKGQQSLYGIRNTGTQAVQLRGVNKTGTAQAGWDSQLQGGNWSALVLANKPLTLSCAQNNKTVACSKLISVCQFTHATFGPQAQGSYWAAENVAGGDIMSAIVKRGIHADT